MVLSKLKKNFKVLLIGFFSVATIFLLLEWIPLNFLYYASFVVYAFCFRLALSDKAILEKSKLKEMRFSFYRFFKLVDGLNQRLPKLVGRLFSFISPVIPFAIMSLFVSSEVEWGYLLIGTLAFELKKVRDTFKSQRA